MDTQILKLSEPYEYIYCNGEVGKHIATYIVGETKIDENGEYHLETHSHPIVKYWNSPQGVVWDKAELTDCEVLCDDTDKRVDIYTFNLLCYQRAEQVHDEEEASGEMNPTFSPSGEGMELKRKLRNYGIGFVANEGRETLEIAVEVGQCSDGYFAQPVGGADSLDFNLQAKTMDELAQMLTEERQDWEEFYDHVVKVKYSPESSLAMGFVESL